MLLINAVNAAGRPVELFVKDGKIAETWVYPFKEPKLVINGGPGSGNFDHAGIPGQVGGSAPSDGGDSSPHAEPEKLASLTFDMTKENHTKLTEAIESAHSSMKAGEFAKWASTVMGIPLKGSAKKVKETITYFINQLSTSRATTDRI